MLSFHRPRHVPNGSPSMSKPVCVFCGKTLAPGVEVREGEKLFHLDCYLLYKRRRP
jgi:hypothetical protein